MYTGSEKMMLNSPYFTTGNWPSSLYYNREDPVARWVQFNVELRMPPKKDQKWASSYVTLRFHWLALIMSRSLLLLLVLASDIHQLLCGSIEKRIRELRSILKRNNAGKLTNALLANNNVMHYTVYRQQYKVCKPRKPSVPLFHSQELTGIMDRLQVSSCFLSNGHDSTLLTKTRAVAIPLSPGLESYEFTRTEFKVFTYVQLVRALFKGFILPSSGFDFCVYSLNIYLLLKSHGVGVTELLLFGLTLKWLFQIYSYGMFFFVSWRIDGDVLSGEVGSWCSH